MNQSGTAQNKLPELKHKDITSNYVYVCCSEIYKLKDIFLNLMAVT